MTTVAELIAKLNEFDPATPVVCEGFDANGFDRLETVHIVRIVPVAGGSHGPAFNYADDASRPAGEPFSAVALTA